MQISLLADSEDLINAQEAKQSKNSEAAAAERGQRVSQTWASSTLASLHRCASAGAGGGTEYCHCWAMAFRLP